MANVKLLAGDFLQGEAHYQDGFLNLRTPLTPWPGLNLPVEAIDSVEAVGGDAQVTFILALKDGRKMSALTDAATFDRLKRHHVA
ncbi:MULTISPECIES: hypothetical protein [Pseudomonas]|uniref:Uncharacterized protein n=1 Tax=Pseudomonas eucalypticola TaxID=2599595 RepID=A0A7D5D8G0_9PSED|nr:MULTISPECIES: hypothetical protein [Pseudomonas]QKZ05473.1 hypothetical protein HWQ56_17380 [Pseudomonas eucalypticola]